MRKREVSPSRWLRVNLSADVLAEIRCMWSSVGKALVDVEKRRYVDGFLLSSDSFGLSALFQLCTPFLD